MFLSALLDVSEILWVAVLYLYGLEDSTRILEVCFQSFPQLFGSFAPLLLVS